MVTPEALADVLRAFLKQEGLVLCRAADTGFPLDGERETTALREIAVLVQDTTDAAAEWNDPQLARTHQTPRHVEKALRLLSRAL